MSRGYYKVPYMCDCAEHNYVKKSEDGSFLLEYDRSMDYTHIWHVVHDGDKSERIEYIGIFTDIQIEALCKILSSDQDILDKPSESDHNKMKLARGY